MLWQEAMQACVMLSASSEPDGEGGRATAYTEGDAFNAAITDPSDTEETRQDRLSSKRSVTVTADRELLYGDSFRDEQGRGYRVTSNSEETPSYATFSFYQASAERWEVADE